MPQLIYTPIMKTCLTLLLAAMLIASGTQSGSSPDQTLRVPLAYKAPGDGPAPNFSPKGTQVQLTPVDANFVLPADAVLPAKTGLIKVGPGEASWIQVLATADADHPADLTRLYLDRNRNGRFDDDGPAATAVPTQNEKTKAWWTSTKAIELPVRYASGDAAEPYLVNFWSVREDTPGAPPQPPAILRVLGWIVASRERHDQRHRGTSGRDGR